MGTIRAAASINISLPTSSQSLVLVKKREEDEGGCVTSVVALLLFLLYLPLRLVFLTTRIYLASTFIYIFLEYKLILFCCICAFHLSVIVVSSHRPKVSLCMNSDTSSTSLHPSWSSPTMLWCAATKAAQSISQPFFADNYRKYP